MKKKLVWLFLFLIIILPYRIKADTISITSDILLNAYLSTGGDLRLDADITLTSDTPVNNETTLDLNGHTLSMSDKSLISYGPLTIKDTSSNQSGKITGTATYIIRVGQSSSEGTLILESGTIDCSAKNYCITVASKGTLKVNGGSIISKNFPIVNTGNTEINGGLVEGTTGGAIYGNTNSTLTLNDGTIRILSSWEAITLSKPGAKFIMNGGLVDATADPKGVAIIAFKNTELTINDGEIRASSAGIMGNGSESGASEGTNAKFTINGGSIISSSIGIYAPQINGETTISGGLIEAGKTGIEIRAGNLTMTGGTIKGNLDTFEVKENTSGTNVVGAAIAIVQHTTKREINVNISGGELISNVSLAEVNPMNNAPEDLAKISINITNGNFTSTSENTVKIDDFEYMAGKFISGGTYTNNVTPYVVDTHGERDNADSSVTVLPWRKATTVHDEDTINIDDKLEGQEVEIHAPEKDGYIIESIIVIDEDGNQITVTNNKFIMPGTNVAIKVNYKKINNPPTSDNLYLFIGLLIISILGIIIINKKRIKA